MFYVVLDGVCMLNGLCICDGDLVLDMCCIVGRVFILVDT